MIEKVVIYGCAIVFCIGMIGYMLCQIAIACFQTAELVTTIKGRRKNGTTKR